LSLLLQRVWKNALYHAKAVNSELWSWGRKTVFEFTASACLENALYHAKAVNSELWSWGRRTVFEFTASACLENALYHAKAVNSNSRAGEEEGAFQTRRNEGTKENKSSFHRKMESRKRIY